MFRQDVLSLYRRIFRISRQWEAVMPTNTEKERQYIQEEARKLFHRNKTITNPEEIRLHIHEANSRIDMALHYKSPYPRLMHMPPTAVPKTSKRQRKAQERIRKQAKPVYMLSDDDVDKWGFTEILLHCNDFGFLSKPSACLPWKRMHSWIILHNNSLMLTPQVSLSKWLNHFSWGCSWHTGTGNVILQNSSCHNVSLIIIF